MISTLVAWVWYDHEEAILEIEFVDGELHNYFDVPSYIYAALMWADSLWEYFKRFIQDRYDFEIIQN